MKKILGVFIMLCMANIMSGANVDKNLTKLPEFESTKLKNGLEVVVIPMRNGTNVVETSVYYKVGSRNEIMGKSGIAHMLEHLNFKSTKNLKAGEFDQIVKSYGGLTNATTSFDYTRYFVRSSAENVSKSLELFAEMMENLKLKDDEFQPERNVVAEERRWRTDNDPIGYLYFRFFNTAFIYHPYHWTPIGFMEDIQSWSIEDIRDFHKLYYQPQNALVVIAGDIEPKDAFKSVEKHFKDIKNAKTPPPKMSVKEPKQDGVRRVDVKKDSEIEYIAMGYKIPNFQSQDQIALSAISEILSGSKASILVKELVDKKQIASQIYAYNMEQSDESVFLFLAVGAKGVSTKTLEEEIYKAIDKIKNAKISADMLERVKINTKASFIYELERASSVASLYGSYLARGDISPLLKYEENINKLDIKTISEVAKKYFVEDNLTIVTLKK